MSKYAVLITEAVFLLVLGIVLLIVCIRKLIGLSKNIEISAPFVSSQKIEIEKTGPKVLEMLKPMEYFKTSTYSFEYELIDCSTNKNVELNFNTLGFRRRGLAMVRYPVKQFNIDRAGTYILNIKDLKPDEDYSKMSVLITKSADAATLFCILGLIVSLGMIAAGIILTAMRLVR